MHPWPSCNGCTRNAVSMSIWVCTLLLLPLSRLHHFNYLSVGNKQSLCPSCGGHKRKVRGTSKTFRPAVRAGIVPPPLANCFRRHWGRYQIDYILTTCRYWNSVCKAQAYPDAGIDSSHNPVVAKLRVKLKKVLKATNTWTQKRKLGVTDEVIDMMEESKWKSMHAEEGHKNINTK